VRRLQVLSQLAGGVLCYEKTWGFGVVKDVDDFYERVRIDFNGKLGHEMSMAYAAETLELIDDEHLLARMHRDADQVRAMVKEAPAELVCITLRSYGDMNMQDLKDRLIKDEVLVEKEWKSFWDAARKALKDDSMVHIPTRRAEAITLLSSPDEHLRQQFGELAGLRDPESIMGRVDRMEADGLFADLAAENASVLADRLAFAIWGAEDRMPALVARALLMARRYDLVADDGNIGERGVKLRETLEALLQPKVLRVTLTKLPVRSVGGLLDVCAAELPELMVEGLLSVMAEMAITVVSESIVWVEKVGREDALREYMGSLVAERKATPAQMLWILRNIGRAEEWGHTDRAELLRQGLDAIEWPAAGEQLRAQHQIRSLFQSGSWLADQLVFLSHEQRVVMLSLVQASRGWDDSDKRGVMAGMIKAFPELAAQVAGGDDGQEDEVRGRFTSWRTFRERQAQFKKLMEVEIPENAREIAVARSYGDLRENAEYKYAKEHQRILYLRQEEMEADLKVVKGTDFAGRSTETAGMGTRVVIRRPDGAEESYCILGEWDRDEELNIISNLSRLAQLLDGHAEGDKIVLPGDAGDEECELLTIEGLDEAIHAWLKEDV
jgi:transcription elongation GreA/GreB family factor